MRRGPQRSEGPRRRPSGARPLDQLRARSGRLIGLGPAFGQQGSHSGGDELVSLDEHAARAAGRVQPAAVVGLRHLFDETFAPSKPGSPLPEAPVKADHACDVGVAVPLRPKRNDRVIEVDRDSTRHRDDHRLARSSSMAGLASSAALPAPVAVLDLVGRRGRNCDASARRVHHAYMVHPSPSVFSVSHDTDRTDRLTTGSERALGKTVACSKERPTLCWAGSS
jgi:hypothetical protein